MSETAAPIPQTSSPTMQSAAHAKVTKTKHSGSSNIDSITQPAIRAKLLRTNSPSGLRIARRNDTAPPSFLALYNPSVRKDARESELFQTEFMPSLELG